MCVKQSFISEEQKRKDFLKTNKKIGFHKLSSSDIPQIHFLSLWKKGRKEAARKETISPGWPASYAFVGKKNLQNIVLWRQRDIFSLFNYLILKMHILGTIRDVPTCTLIYQLTEVKEQITISLFMVFLTPAYPSAVENSVPKAVQATPSTIPPYFSLQPGNILVH